jgi:hypothetical protein
MRLIAAAVMPLLAVPAAAQQRLPIIDMHLHASPADANGPPPLALCVPIPAFPARDPSRPWGDIFLDWPKSPPCSDPVWSPATDQALIEQTQAVLERRRVIGVLSGTLERVQPWQEAAPD